MFGRGSCHVEVDGGRDGGRPGERLLAARRRPRARTRPGRLRCGSGRTRVRVHRRSTPPAAPPPARSVPSGASRNSITPAPAGAGVTSASATGRPSAASTAARARSTPGRELHELGVVAAAEPGRDLDDARPVGPEDHLDVPRAGPDPERLDRPDGGRRPRRTGRARADRRAAGRRRAPRGSARGRSPPRRRPALGGEAVHRHLGARDERLEEDAPAARLRPPPAGRRLRDRPGRRGSTSPAAPAGRAP